MMKLLERETPTRANPPVFSPNLELRAPAMAKYSPLHEPLVSTYDDERKVEPAGGIQVAHVIDRGHESPAYQALAMAGLICSDHVKRSLDELDMLRANDHRGAATKRSFLSCLCCGPVGYCVYHRCLHSEFLVPAGHVRLLRDQDGGYMFAGPGMHNLRSMFIKAEGKEVPIEGEIRHGDGTIVIVEQGFVGLAMDKGQPILLPPGLHQWKSDTMRFERAVPLNDHVLKFGPYTLLTVDEGYAAVTQDNGRMRILEGGHAHLLTHKNWKFEKFLTLKIQTDDLAKIQATSADNIIMRVTSTVNWRITNVEVAATMAAETMARSGVDGAVSGDISKLRNDVLKQAIASLAAFIGTVNYSDSFTHAAAVAQSAHVAAAGGAAEQDLQSGDNPLFDIRRMDSAVAHANKVTKTYGVTIMSINVISADPVDTDLTAALASGAVASAQALQAETAARGNAKALRIEAEARNETELLSARADAEAMETRARGQQKAAELLQTSDVAVQLALIDRSSAALSGRDKFFFGKDPAWLGKILLNGGEGALAAESHS
jgi:regulator of protease activity HflC (stomatin/prohibitin superfamily)